MTSSDFDKFMKVTFWFIKSVSNLTKQKVQPSKNREANSVSPMMRRGESPTTRKETKQDAESVYTKALSKK